MTEEAKKKLRDGFIKQFAIKVTPHNEEDAKKSEMVEEVWKRDLGFMADWFIDRIEEETKSLIGRVDNKYNQYVEEYLGAHYFAGDIETSEGQFHLCSIDEVQGERISKYINYMAEMCARYVPSEIWYSELRDKNPLSIINGNN